MQLMNIHEMRRITSAFSLCVTWQALTDRIQLLLGYEYIRDFYFFELRATIHGLCDS